MTRHYEKIKNNRQEVTREQDMKRGKYTTHFDLPIEFDAHNQEEAESISQAICKAIEETGARHGIGKNVRTTQKFSTVTNHMRMTGGHHNHY